MITAQEIRQKALGRMNEIASANRRVTLDEFRELLVPEVAALISPDFPDVGAGTLLLAVDRSITVVANRLALDFDGLVASLSGEADTDPTELVPDTERPV